MKRILLFMIFFIFSIFLLNACSINYTYEHSEHVTVEKNESEYDFAPGLVAPPLAAGNASMEYLTFEEALERSATDVVVVQYVGSRPFGNRLTEFEFIVLERIVGNAADRIFVYAERVNTSVFGGGGSIRYMAGDMTFSHGAEYLLPLRRINSPYAKTHADGYTFIRSIVIDLSNPENSTMYGEPLQRHSDGLSFGRGDSRQQIISHVADVIMSGDGIWFETIRSDVIEDIINGSPYVLVVEINDTLRLSGEQSTTDWMTTDIFYISVVEVLKGNRSVESFGESFAMIFFADTVRHGERHIVAATPIREGSTWFEFTARNSLFRMDQRDEILAIIEQGAPSEVSQLTLHFYGRPDAPVVIPVEIGRPLCPVTVADVTRRVYGEGPHDRNDGWAFWGWFTDAQLDSSGRVRDGHRRPTVGTMGFDIDAVMTGAQLNPHAVNGNVDLYAIWIRWGDVDDNGRLDFDDMDSLSRTVSNLMPRPAINLAAADVNRDGNVDLNDLDMVSRYVSRLVPRAILGQRPVAPAFVPLSVGEVRFEASHESGAPGDYVLVRVSVEDNTSLGFYMTLFDVEFDVGNMEFVDYRGGNYSAKGMEAPLVAHMEDDGAVRILWMREMHEEMTAYTDTGLYLELQFRIRDTASSGTTEVNLIAPPVGGVAGFGGIINIPFSFVSGSVTVIN